MDRKRQPAHIVDLDKHHRIIQAANLTEKVTARIFQRGSVVAKSNQAFDSYDIWGKPTEAAEDFKQQVNQTISESVALLSERELDYFGMLVPQFVQAIASSEKYVDEVYQKDTLSIVKIAIDWFMHPEEVKKTHIRIGFGGEEIVNSRLPAYIVPALHMLEDLKKINGHYINWAMLNALQDTVGGNRAQDINTFMVNGISQAINQGGKTAGFDKYIEQKVAAKKSQYKKAKQFDEVGEKQKAVLEEMEENKFLTTEQARIIIIDAWTSLAGKPPEMKELQKLYHFTDGLPKIVAFNAAHAAIEIDRMDANRVIPARDNSQKLLRAYVSEFHPDLVNQLAFQNDIPWSQLSHHAKMQLLFAHELIDTYDGEKEEVETRLAKFGKHHRRNLTNTILGMPISEAYGAAHAFFFQDPYAVTAWDEKLPNPQMMEYVQTTSGEIDIPRNIVFHQGPPEKEFGVYRKLFSENATTTLFLDWLKRRQKRAKFESDTQLYFDVLATQIFEQAKIIQQDGDVKGGFTACVGKAIYFKEKTSDAVGVCADPKTMAAKQEFFRFMNTDRFKNAKNQEAEWLLYVGELTVDKPWETPEEIEEVVSKMKKYQERMKQVEDRVHILRQREDDESTEALIASQGTEFQEVINPRNKLELVVSVGNLPTYYHFEPTDSVIWPTTEPVMGQKYIDAKDRVARFYGVGTTVTDQVAVNLLKEQEMQGWSVFSDGITAFIKDSIPEEHFLKLIDTDKKALEQTYSAIIQMEYASIDHDAILFELDKRVRALVEERAASISELTKGIDHAAALFYVTKFYLPALNNIMMTDLAAEQFKVVSAQRDFQLMMEDIAPDNPLDAERHYNELLTHTFSVN